jgi:hypothetical protein
MIIIIMTLIKVAMILANNITKNLLKNTAASGILERKKSHFKENQAERN